MEHAMPTEFLRVPLYPRIIHVLMLLLHNKEGLLLPTEPAFKRMSLLLSTSVSQGNQLDQKYICISWSWDPIMNSKTGCRLFLFVLHNPYPEFSGFSSFLEEDIPTGDRGKVFIKKKKVFSEWFNHTSVKDTDFQTKVVN